MFIYCTFKLNFKDCALLWSRGKNYPTKISKPSNYFPYTTLTVTLPLLAPPLTLPKPQVAF